MDEVHLAFDFLVVKELVSDVYCFFALQFVLFPPRRAPTASSNSEHRLVTRWPAARVKGKDTYLCGLEGE